MCTPLPEGRSPRSRQRPPFAHSEVATYHRGVVHDATKGERRAARERVSRYYESELAKLIGRVAEALTRYRHGEIDAHEVDDLIHRYSMCFQRVTTPVKPDAERVPS